MIQVFILECIDPATGDDLGNQCADRFIYPRAETENVALSVANVKTKYEMVKLLNDAYHTMKAFGKPSPPIILHIDAHGNENGFIIRDDTEIFSWKDLYGFCTQLTRVSNIKLILIVGACQGIHALNMIRATNIAPFFCMFGPSTNISNYELMQFYGRFYGELFTTHLYDVTAKKVMDTHGESIAYADSPYMFRWMFKGYLESMKGYRHVVRKKHLLGKIHRLNVPEWVKREKIALVKNWDKTIRINFEQIKKTFFLIDEYPENVKRFASITYDSIKNDDTLPPLF